MVSLYTVPPGGVIGSQDIDQFTLTLTGGQNTPVSIRNTDPIAYTLQLQNTDAAGKTLLIYGPDGTTVLNRVQGNGVVASPDGTAAAPIVTTTHAQTLTNKTLTGPIVNSGGLQVTAGNIGVGGAPNASIGVQNVATNNTQGFFSGGTLTAIGTGTALYGFHANPTLSAGGFTGHTYAGVQIDGVTAPAGFTNNYSLSVGTPSGATGENYAIKASGVSFVGGAGGGLIISSNLGVAPTAPSSTIALGSGVGTTATAGTNGAPPAQVAGYWFINVAGTIAKVPYYNN